MSDTPTSRSTAAAASLRGDNHRMVRKLLVVTALMFCFGYALVPIYRAICTALGINVLSLAELGTAANAVPFDKNTQVDLSRTITIEFDANARSTCTPVNSRP
jgi:cytochrome c oxidase assembly protein subunit 11